MVGREGWRTLSQRPRTLGTTKAPGKKNCTHTSYSSLGLFSFFLSFLHTSCQALNKIISGDRLLRRMQTERERNKEGTASVCLFLHDWEATRPFLAFRTAFPYPRRVNVQTHKP